MINDVLSSKELDSIEKKNIYVGMDYLKLTSFELIGRLAHERIFPDRVERSTRNFYWLWFYKVTDEFIEKLKSIAEPDYNLIFD